MWNRIKLSLQVAWVTTVVVMLFMGFNSCAATDKACFDAGGRMFLTMFVLSFPAGIFCVVVALLFLNPVAVDYLNDYVIFWLIMSCAGYFQWFVLVPKLFAKPNLITLGIQQANVPPNETAAETAPRRTPKRNRVRLISPYDKRGRTPLERALSTDSTNTSA